MPKDRIKPLSLTSINSATVDAVTFKPINSNGLDGATVIITINNASSGSVIISYDGSNDHDYLAAGDVISYDLQTNNQVLNEKALLPKGTVVSVRGVSGVGFIYLSGWYQE